MRLINVHTYEQTDRFKDNRTPPYAILSHRWTDSEISYQDFTSTDFLSTTLDAGPSKIIGACTLAKEKLLDWIWIDTCCIDKTSGPELSRSINSMFQWYQDAQVCFVYLADVNSQNKDIPEVQDQILKSEWFTRGWTLQEMLASSEINFRDVNWKPLGTRSQLTRIISRATKIVPEYLEDFRSASIAQKMSWMADRVTTEDEDTAYCMLGIFDINMDLRYGEGKKAFRRLQEMIISGSPDETIFAWRSDKIKSSGLLAPWPDCFRGSGNIFLLPDKKPSPLTTRGAYQMTNQGLRFPIPAQNRSMTEVREFKLTLKCWFPQQGKWMAVVIFLSSIGGYWKRIRCNDLGKAMKVQVCIANLFSNRPITEDLYIPQRVINK